MVAPSLRGAAPTEHAVLTTAAQVRALAQEDARRALAVRLRAVFMGEADPEGIAFVVQDQTEDIYVQGPPDLVAGLRRGDLLEIEGVSDPGGFAPYVVARSIRRVGRKPVPEPSRVTLGELNAGRMDAKWVEFSGIVRSVEPTIPSDAAPPPPGTRYAAPPGDLSRRRESKTNMKLASGDARVVVQVYGKLRPEDYVDAEVRVRGLCFNLHNYKRQFVKPFVQVPRGVGVEIERPPPRRPFGGPTRPVSSLLQFEQLAGQSGHRVHVRGVVVHHQPGSVLWIRDGDSSLRVETDQNQALQPGDEVDVLGFPCRGEYSAVMEDAVFLKRASGPPPPPRVLEGIDGALQHDADLVRLDARLADIRPLPDGVALTLDWHRTAIRAQLHLPRGGPVPAGWRPGSLVRAVGVCSVVTDEAGPLGGLWEPRSFRLLLRSQADLSVIRPPPWWSEERVVWILSGSLALAVGLVAVVSLASRRRLKEQERRRAMAEVEFAAILNERNRLAREIHDTLSQSLGAISVQLELARTRAAETSPPALRHLAAAHQLTRAALADARDSIWNMRSQILEKCDLGEALERILRQMTEDTQTAPAMRVEGARRRLPPVVENNLLRIGQEAIANASKHARAGRIEVRLVFDDRAVRLTVEDDGVGLPAGPRPNGDRRGFGLVGIKERAQLLGGTVEIKSASGKGTCVAVVVRA